MEDFAESPSVVGVAEAAEHLLGLPARQEDLKLSEWATDHLTATGGLVCMNKYFLWFINVMNNQTDFK